MCIQQASQKHPYSHGCYIGDESLQIHGNHYSCLVDLVKPHCMEGSPVAKRAVICAVASDCCGPNLEDSICNIKAHITMRASHASMFAHHTDGGLAMLAPSGMLMQRHLRVGSLTPQSFHNHKKFENAFYVWNSSGQCAGLPDPGDLITLAPCL